MMVAVGSYLRLTRHSRPQILFDPTNGSVIASTTLVYLTSARTGNIVERRGREDRKNEEGKEMQDEHVTR